MRYLSVLMIVLGALALAACGGATSTSPSSPNSTAAPAAETKTLGQISVSDLKAKLDANENVFLLDVRTPEEFTQDGHVAQATLIPLDQLDSRLSELPTDKPILCICRSGNRSTTACNDLLARGYDATNVTGGTNAWKAAGLPVDH
ncbi:MAG: rhodanese-like domain-containing protein [Oscillochloris sp.]|nr:rhodanese-like domain-containing protein [Oscillochloris sp.]